MIYVNKIKWCTKVMSNSKPLFSLEGFLKLYDAY